MKQTPEFKTHTTWFTKEILGSIKATKQCTVLNAGKEYLDQTP